jgi:AraC-like DNA-binding protein
MSPHEYIINYRLQLSQNLLGQTDMSISDICFETGFSSESVFCASFKKHLGISPTAYRKSQKHPEEDQPLTAPIVIPFTK